MKEGVDEDYRGILESASRGIIALFALVNSFMIAILSLLDTRERMAVVVAVLVINYLLYLAIYEWRWLNQLGSPEEKWRNQK